MKTSVNHLLRGCALTLLTISINANAQHLPNVGFDNWKTACGSTTLPKGGYGVNEQRPGVEPTDWNGSSVTSILSKNYNTVAKGADGDYVILQNMEINALGIKSPAPGYITFGNPWVYGATPVKNADGGTYSGKDPFIWKPEALKLRVKRTDSTSEDSYVIAYLWNGTFKSNIGKNGSPTTACDNVDRAILSRANAGTITGDGKLVASLEKTITKDIKEWTELTIEFDKYNELAGDPTMMNVIICAGNYWDRTALVAGTTLWVDDVDFVYPTTTYAGMEMTTANMQDDRTVARPMAATSDWNASDLTVEDYGNTVRTDGTGYKTTHACVTVPTKEFGDIKIDNVELTHYNDYDWINHAGQEVTLADNRTATVKIEGELRPYDGKKLVYLEVTPQGETPNLVTFVDKAHTTGIDEIDGEAVKATVFGGQGYVSVSGVEGTVTVYSLSGAKVAEANVDGEAVIAVPAGVAIVAYPGGAVKTIVR